MVGIDNGWTDTVSLERKGRMSRRLPQLLLRQIQ
jgi:hypothetical protein